MNAPFSINVEALGPAGEFDESAVALLTEDGFMIEGFFGDSVGLSWHDLARLLEHPFVQEKLEEAREDL